MNPLEAKNFIRSQFENNGFRFVESYINNTFDLVFQHSQLDYNIFFKFYNFSRDLAQDWFEAQEKVEEVMRREKIPPYNTYLIFALPSEDLPSEEEIQRIIFDEYACRKLIFPVDSSPQKLKEDLFRFPFYPLDISAIAEQRMPKGVLEALLETEFDRQLMNDIVGRVSPSQIIKKILNNEYKERIEREVIEQPDEPHIVNQCNRKLKQIVIENFRGIGKEIPLNLDADIIVIYGPNGTGKTSIFDAIEWAITGQVERLQKPIEDVDLKVKDILINLFHKDKSAKVKLELSINEETRSIERSLSLFEIGKSRVTIDEKNVQDKTVIAVVTGNEPLMSQKRRVERFRSGFLASHTLKQNVLTNFISAVKPKERYDAFAYISGTQDFVRFRDKVKDIVNEMNKQIKKLQPELDVLIAEKGRIQQRVADKEIEHQQLLKVISTFSKRNLIKEIEKLLKEVNLPTSVNFVKMLKSPTKELADSIIVISSQYVGSTDEQLGNLTNLIEQVKIVIQREPKIKETKDLIESLTGERKKVEEQKQTFESELIKKKQQYVNSEKSRERLQIVLDNIDWLLRMKPLYGDNKNRLKDVSRELEKFHAIEKEITKKIYQVEKNKNEIGQRLQNNESEISKKGVLHTTIKKILRSIPEWQKAIIQQKNIIKEITQSDNQLKLIQKSREEASEELNNLTDKITKVESQLNLQKKEYNQKVQLIGKLKEYINSPECPLCGQKWNSIQILLARVEEKIKELPESLKVLLGREKELKTQKEKIEFKITQFISRMDELKSQWKSVLSKKEEIDINIETWEKQLKSLPSYYPTKRIDDRLIPEEKLLEQFQRKTEQEISNLHKAKTELEEALATVDGEYKDISQELTRLRETFEKNKKIFNNLNQTIGGTQKEIRDRNLVELATEEMSVLMKKEEGYTKQLSLSTEANENLENELSSLNNTINQLSLKSENILKKISISNTETQKFYALDNSFRKMVRPYIPKAEERPLREVLEMLEGLKNESMGKYQLLTTLRDKASDLKRLKITDFLKNSLQDLSLEKLKFDNRLRELRKKLKSMEKWKNILEGLKRAANQKRKLQAQNHFDLFKPTINLIYHRLNAHPLLGNIEVLFEREELKIVSKMSSFAQKNIRISEVPPSHVFSESQLNTLAISIFLASALEQRWSWFKSILIDDPVQNMDDLNSFAFLDLILGLANRGHQFMISTCNQDLYKLMLMKFSCLNRSKNRFKAYRLQGIYRDGPKVIEDTRLIEETKKEVGVEDK